MKDLPVAERANRWILKVATVAVLTWLSSATFCYAGQLGDMVFSIEALTSAVSPYAVLPLPDLTTEALKDSQFLVTYSRLQTLCDERSAGNCLTQTSERSKDYVKRVLNRSEEKLKTIKIALQERCVELNTDGTLNCNKQHYAPDAKVLESLLEPSFGMKLLGAGLAAMAASLTVILCHGIPAGMHPHTGRYAVGSILTLIGGAFLTGFSKDRLDNEVVQPLRQLIHLLNSMAWERTKLLMKVLKEHSALWKTVAYQAKISDSSEHIQKVTATEELSSIFDALPPEGDFTIHLLLSRPQGLKQQRVSLSCHSSNAASYLCQINFHGFSYSAVTTSDASSMEARTNAFRLMETFYSI